MTRRAFIHIGLPKTGTTYLQETLWANKERLGDQGLLLPGRHRRRHMLASLDLREDDKLARRAGDVAAPWQDLVDEVQAWPGDAMVSHEFLGAAAPHQIERMLCSLEGFEVHVLITARPLTTLGLSMWQQWVKFGGRVGIDGYPRRSEYDPTDGWGWGCFDLADILTRWSGVVAPPRIHVLPVDTGAPPQALWERFANVIGVDGTGFAVPDQPVNQTLGLVEIELLRRVNPHLKEFTTAAGRGHWIRGQLAEGGTFRRTGERFTAGPEKLQELVARGRRAIDLLRDGDFDVVGDLSLLEPVVPEGLRHPDEVSETELLESASVAIANLLGDVRMLTRELRSTRRAHRELKSRWDARPSRRLASLWSRARRGIRHDG